MSKKTFFKPDLIFIACILLASLFFLANYIFLGNARKAAKDITTVPSYGSQFAPNKITNDINTSWDYIGVGDIGFNEGRYEDAAKAYYAAYQTNYGSKAVSGLSLAKTYEFLKKYDEGIAVIEDMIKTKVLSEKGIQNANEIKSRLLVAKSQATQKTDPRAS